MTQHTHETEPSGPLVYGPRSTKRRSRAEINAIRDAICRVLREIQPATIRQLFYQLVSRGVIAKSEAEYKNTVGRLTSEMRRDETLPFGWIAENTRWVRKPDSYPSLHTMLTVSQQLYRRALWDTQPVRVEIWLEKDALAGVLYRETATFDVPLMVTRGYPSLSYLYEAAREIRQNGKPTYLYYFGDDDPSGCDISRAVEQGVCELAPEVEIHFERVAVKAEQIALWDLPTRPTKKSDSRSKRFVGDSVEVDAIPPDRLREMARRCIEQHIDVEQLDRLRRVEGEERRTLGRIISALGTSEFGQDGAR